MNKNWKKLKIEKKEKMKNWKKRKNEKLKKKIEKN